MKFPKLEALKLSEGQTTANKAVQDLYYNSKLSKSLPQDEEAHHRAVLKLLDAAYNLGYKDGYTEKR